MNNQEVAALRRLKLNEDFKRYNSALLKLSILPEFQLVVDYLTKNYIDPSPQSSSSDLVRLGNNLGKMELAKEIIQLSRHKQEELTNE